MAPTKEQFIRAATAIEALIGSVSPNQWGAPTPCDKWTVREVVNHLVGGNLVIAARFCGDQVPELNADHLGSAEPTAAFRESAAKLLVTLDLPDIFIREYRTASAGAMTGETLMHMRIADHMVHGWDLATATGNRLDLPEDLVEQSLAFATSRMTGVPRDGSVFAEIQAVPDDAPAIDRLVAFTGRTISPA
jgi:uncharacterized protein (TIGR03086 family)